VRTAIQKTVAKATVNTRRVEVVRVEGRISAKENVFKKTGSQSESRGSPEKFHNTFFQPSRILLIFRGNLP
jgi:hypothetical protein